MEAISDWHCQYVPLKGRRQPVRFLVFRVPVGDHTEPQRGSARISKLLIINPIEACTARIGFAPPERHLFTKTGERAPSKEESASGRVGILLWLSDLGNAIAATRQELPAPIQLEGKDRYPLQHEWRLGVGPFADERNEFQSFQPLSCDRRSQCVAEKGGPVFNDLELAGLLTLILRFEQEKATVGCEII
jgi:hypothetical protein